MVYKTLFSGLLLGLVMGLGGNALAESGSETAEQIKAKAEQVARENEVLRKKIAELEAMAASHGDSEKQIEKNIQLIKAKLATKKASGKE
ncbi:MAG: hypothetical protein ACWA5X_09420 [bacterium]